MDEPFSRRRFLEAGLALVSLPTWAAGCGAQRSHLVLGPARPSPLQPASSAAPATATPGTYFERFGVQVALLERVLGEGLGRGGEFCEVFLQHRVSHWVGVEDAEVSRAYCEVALGAGIRVLQGDATGFAYTEDLTETALIRAAQTAAAVASGPAAVRPVAPAVRQIPSAYALAVPWEEIGIDQKLPVVQAADRLVRARDARIIKATIFLVDHTAHVLVANSEGLVVEDEQPMTELHVTCVAQHRGKTETSWHSRAARRGLDFFSSELLQGLAQEAADDTVLLFEAKTGVVGELPVVLATGITGLLLHEAIGHGMEADFNRKNTSIYANRIGQRVAPESVTIIDDGTNPRMRGSLNIDDEGTPAQRTVLVERGILRSYLHDRISAKHYQLPSTGSGRRESYRFPPVPRMRNTYLLNGPYEPQEIIASVKRGLYAEMFWNGEVNIGAGDFTFYLKHGRLIENGKLSGYVKDANLIGRGPSVLEKISMVGNDLAFFPGAGQCGKDYQFVPVGFGLPTVRAEGISIGGRA